MKHRLLGPLARRWPWFRTALRVNDRVSEIHGGYVASAITLAAFTSLFPLLLVAVAVIGAMSVRGVDVAGHVIGRFGLVGPAADIVLKTVHTAERSRRVAGPIGVAGLLWTGLGVVAALQHTFDLCWQVSSRGWKDKLWGLAWLVGSVVILLVSFAVTAVTGITPWLAPLSVAAGLAIDVALWLWTLRTLTNVDVPLRAHLPGAVIGAIGLEVLKFVGSIYVPHAVASSSSLYGSIGAVFAILAWLFFFGRLTVYAAVLNVVRWEEDHGTVTVEIELPKHPDIVAVEATRAGEAKVTVRPG